MATNSLELMLSNIRNVSSTLSRIAKKLSMLESLSVREEAVIILTQQWLNQEPFLALFNNRSFPVPPHAASHEDDFDSPSVEKQQTLMNILEASQSTLNSWTSTPGLDEVHDLDWDADGLELSGSTPESINETFVFSDSFTFAAAPESYKELSPVSPLRAPPHYGDVIHLASACRNRNNSSSMSFSSSYHGLYEEVMEMSLELEEEFYSDEDDLECLLAEIKDEERPSTSQSHNTTLTDELFLPPDVPMNKYNYQLVRIDDDLKSVASDFSTNNSPATKRRVLSCGGRSKTMSESSNDSYALSDNTVRYPNSHRRILWLPKTKHGSLMSPRKGVFV